MGSQIQLEIVGFIRDPNFHVAKSIAEVKDSFQPLFINFHLSANNSFICPSGTKPSASWGISGPQNSASSWIWLVHVSLQQEKGMWSRSTGYSEFFFPFFLFFFKLTFISPYQQDNPSESMDTLFTNKPLS